VAGGEKLIGSEKKGMAQVLESRSQLSRAVRIQRLAHILDLEQLLLLAELAPEHLHILLVLRHGEERAAFNRTELSGRFNKRRSAGLGRALAAAGRRGEETRP
jgi:hypothetical protein